MARNLAKSASPPESPGFVWDTILRVTEHVGGDEAKAIRVLLYLAIVTGKGRTFWRRLKFSVKSYRRLAVGGGRTIRAVEKGRPLFAFLYDTGANTNNLLPVFQAARARGCHPNTLSGEGVDLRTKGLEDTEGSVNIAELVAATTMAERLRALADARKHFAAVSAELKRVALQWEAVIHGNRSWIVGELTLGIIGARALRRLYEAWQPGFLISTSNMWPFDYAMFAEARRFGIPSFVVQHGIINRYWWPFEATRMFLWGKAFENELLKLGAPANQLAICGMPAADHVFSRYDNKAARNPGRAPSSYVILSDTHGRELYPQVYSRFKSFLKVVLAATPNIRWSVKLHPVENLSFYQELLDGHYPNFSILPKSTSLADAVAQADVACTLWSTAGLEAMIMRRPLVVFDADPLIYEYAWWPKTGGGTYVPTVDAVLDFIKRASDTGRFLGQLVSEQDQFLAANFANPGRAADAVLNMIEEVTGRGRVTSPVSHADRGVTHSATSRDVAHGLHVET